MVEDKSIKGKEVDKTKFKANEQTNRHNRPAAPK